MEPVTCRNVVAAHAAGEAFAMAWSGPRSPAHDPWCAGVGPGFAASPRDALASVADATPFLNDVAILSWNIHGGGGDVDAIIRDLRSGQLDGRPTQHFVLMLQEAVRVGGAVPTSWPLGAKATRRVANGKGAREDASIEGLAARHQLHLFYVPSTRNGKAQDPPEDRGNAILSTLPLADLEAMELPNEKQRRVTVAATIRVQTLARDIVPLRLANLHLDLRSGWGRFHRSFGIGRANQARWTVERFSNDSFVIVGGDLNTWVRGSAEPAARLLGAAFSHNMVPVGKPTVPAPWLLPDRMLDHLFFRLPEGLGGWTRVVRSRYGSDHHPVVARIGALDSAELIEAVQAGQR
jgi:endonuclease/exonuclease/phosphatase family metal-dependent hydrolase